MSDDPPFDLPTLSPEELYRRAQEVDPWPGEPVEAHRLSRLPVFDPRPLQRALEPAVLMGLADGMRRSTQVLGEYVNRWQEGIAWAFRIPGLHLGLEHPTRRELAVQRRLETQMRRTHRRAQRRARRARQR